MKKVNWILCILTSIFLTGCVNFHGTDVSIWADGAWIAPTICFVGASIFFWTGWKASRSNSDINPIYGGGDGGNVPFWQTGWPILGAMAFLGGVAIIFIQYGER